MLFGFLGYLFGLFLMYLFSFGSYEGPRLASCDRYIGIYLIAWSVIVFAGLFKALQPYDFIKKRSMQFLAMGLMVAMLFVLTYKHYHLINKPSVKIRSVWRFRQAIQQITNKVKKYTKVQDRIFVVWQNDENYVPRIINYELIPRGVAGSASFIKYPSKTNVWAQTWSPKKFTNELKSYDYLLLGYTDKEFWDIFGKLFSARPPRLKPLVNYEVCIGTGFNSMCQAGCKLQIEQAYLFKIRHQNNTIQLIPVGD
jgi:hypothetical protein